MHYYCRTTIIFLIVFMLTMPNEVKPRIPHKQIADLLFYALYGHRNVTQPNIQPPIYTDAEGVIRYHEYPVETHEVVTEDGYMLNIQRIPHSRYSNALKTKVPIVLVPGMIASSLYYLINGKFSLATTLSDAGYDVWLHNNRGSRFALKHKTLSSEKDHQYWNFTYHEMGMYDMPAVVDYILSVTSQRQLYLLGHSMGGTLISIFLSENPSYNDKIRKSILLAPAIKMTRTTFPFGQQPCLAYTILSLFDEMDIVSYSDNFTTVSGYFCSDPSGYELCKLLFSRASSFVFDMGDDDAMEFIIDFLRTVSSINVKTVKHYVQLIHSDIFGPYDYGKKGNMIVYGQTQVPQYNLKKITVPMSIYYSDHDVIVNGRDMVEALPWLPANVTMRYADPLNHVDFLSSKVARKLIFLPILEELDIMEQQYNYSNYNSDYNLMSTSFIIMMLCSSIYLISKSATGTRISVRINKI